MEHPLFSGVLSARTDSLLVFRVGARLSPATSVDSVPTLKQLVIFEDVFAVLSTGSSHTLHRQQESNL